MSSSPEPCGPVVVHLGAVARQVGTCPPANDTPLAAAPRPSAPAPGGSASPTGLTFEEVYARWYHEVARWARALGGPSRDVEDLTQDVFLVVRRKLHEFDGGNLGGWLYRITQRTVRDHRQTAWSRRSLLPPSDEEPEPAVLFPLRPDQAFERKEAARVLAELLGRMSPKRRTAFVLHTIQGYSGEEIASLENISVNTVWTRLHHARRDLATLIEQRATSAPRRDV